MTISDLKEKLENTTYTLMRIYMSFVSVLYVLIRGDFIGNKQLHLINY